MRPSGLIANLRRTINAGGVAGGTDCINNLLAGSICRKHLAGTSSQQSQGQKIAVKSNVFAFHHTLCNFDQYQD
jgi:hypothetical protein